MGLPTAVQHYRRGGSGCCRLNRCCSDDWGRYSPLAIPVGPPLLSAAPGRAPPAADEAARESGEGVADAEAVVGPPLLAFLPL